MSKQKQQTASKVASTPPEESEIGASKPKSFEADDLLKADHRKVEGLFQKFQQTDDDEQKASIAREICSELMVHALLEEEIFYPACREKGVEDEALDEAQVEHDGAKVLITELLSAEPKTPFYVAKVKVLSEYIKHHVGEEEKSDGMFAKARKQGVDMAALGQRLQTRKTELTAMAEAERLQPPRFRALQSPIFIQEEERMNRQMSGRDEYGRFTGDDNGGRGGSQGRQMQGRHRDDDDDDYRRGRGSQERGRDESGRFMSDDDDHRRGGDRSRGFQERDREESGRFMRDDDRGRSFQGRERDESGRFMSDDDRGGSNRGRSFQGRERDESGRFMSDDDRGGSSRGRQSGRYEDDDDHRLSRGGGQRGWFGDSEGHAQASRRGWETRHEEDNGRSSSRGRLHDDDDDRRMSSRSGGSSSRSRDDDEDGRGWFGDPQGHSEASRKGWEHREGQAGSRSQSRPSSQSRSRDDDDRRSSRSGSGSSGSRSGQSQGGWFGDSRGHAEAARRGWENR